MASKERCSPLRFRQSCHKLGLEIVDSGKIVYTDFENGFWVGVAQKEFAPLNFPVNELIIGFSMDIEDGWAVDEVLPLGQRELFLALLREMEGE